MSWLVRLMVAAAPLAAAGAAPAAEPAPAIFAYVHAVPGKAEIVVMDAFGRDRRVVARGRDPDWSPDGDRLAYWRGRTTYVANADGSAERAVTQGREPTWSADGARLAVADAGRIWTVRTDGSDRRPLVAGTQPDWSSLDEIAFVREGDLYVVPAGGGEPRRLLDGYYHATYREPAWGPDGRRIALRSDRYDSASGLLLWDFGSSLIGAPGLEVVRQEDATWSPDATAVAYAGNGDICVYSIRYDPLWYARLTRRTDGIPNLEPAWKPGSGTAVPRAEGRNEVDPPSCGSRVASRTDYGGNHRAAGRRQVVRYAFSFENRTGVTADGVWFVEDLVGPAELLSARSSQGTCRGVAPTPLVECRLGALPPKGRASVEFRFRPLGRIRGNSAAIYGGDLGLELDELDRLRTVEDCEIGGDYGNDRLIGTNRRDVICGFAGRDVLRGGGGRDLLYGGPGNDSFDARDGARDVVEGGSGRDVALVDPGLLDRVHDVEIVR